jgi:hypothetical protein
VRRGTTIFRARGCATCDGDDTPVPIVGVVHQLRTVIHGAPRSIAPLSRQ